VLAAFRIAGLKRYGPQEIKLRVGGNLGKREKRGKKES